MCGIAGFCKLNINYREDSSKWYSVLQSMCRIQKHRGPDDDGFVLESHCGLAHTRLSVLDPVTGMQPITRLFHGHKVTICYNGELYNMPTLRRHLESEGIVFDTKSDTEVILMGYLLYGIDFINKLNGIFSFAIWDETYQKLYLFRDRIGVKPLFYMTNVSDADIVFSSEIKGIFKFPDIKPAIDNEGWCEVWALGPAKTYGKGIFKGVKELLPGHMLIYDGRSVNVKPYWKLASKPHEDSYPDTVEKVRYLVTDAIKLQMLSDVPICTFLSGGIDSSLVTSVCSGCIDVLDTYSFDFKDNDVNFKSNVFQPSLDRPFVDKMVSYCNTRHHYLECTNEDLYDYLFEAVDARDLPCMADVESSMLYFCKLVVSNHKVALTGECADEIFGGYPWFHKKECFDADIFPWSMDMGTRTMLLKDEVIDELPIEDYARNAYENTLSEVPVLEGESKEEKRRREIAYLNLRWFMQTLLDRMDRCSMHVGLEARVPFADHRIVEYLWNVPWEMKCPNGVVKGLLRDSAVGYLPDEVLYRKKSPYPKTYDPQYEALLKDKLLTVLHNSHSPLCRFIDLTKVENYISNPLDYSRPFYGQLMAGPQLLAYLLQINYWMEKYKL